MQSGNWRQENESFPVVDAPTPTATESANPLSTTAQSSTPAAAAASSAAVPATQPRRRRSSTISGGNPAEVPITPSEHRLADQIRILNLQNAQEAARLSLAARRIPSSRPEFLRPLDLQPASSPTAEDSDRADDKTPTQDHFPPIQQPPPTISEPEIISPRPSHARTSSVFANLRRLSPIPDLSGEKTPTRLSPSPGEASLAAPPGSPLPRQAQ